MNPLKTIMALCLAGTLAVQAQTIVERRGALKVSGNQVVDQAGKPIQLTGMSFFWDQWMSKYYTKATVDWLVSDWKCSIVRAALAVDSGSGGYLKVPTSNLNTITKVVDAAIANGIYVIIDWHEEMAVNHTEQSKTFFTMMAKKYGKLPNVIFEIYNEPHNKDPDLNPTWSSIKPYAEEVISGIRQYSDNLVIVGTANFSQDVDEASGDPIDPGTYGAVAYTLHFYAGTHGAELRTKATTAMTAGIPIFVTEWGTTTSDGGQPKGTPPVVANIATAATNTWIQFLNRYKISSCNWSVSDKNEGASILKAGTPNSGWDPDSNLTQSGVYVRNLMTTQCDNDPTVCPYFGDPPGPLAIPGAVPAASTTQAYGVTKEASTEPTGGIQLASVDSGDWVSYTVNAAVSDTFEVRARISVPTMGGTLTIHTAQGDLPILVPPTGNPNAWIWAYTTSRLILPAGTSLIEARFTGPGQNLFKLHHLEFVKNASKILAAPGYIPVNAYTAPLTSTGIVRPDDQDLILSRMKALSSASYTVSIPKAGTYSFAGNFAAGSNGGKLNVWIDGTASKKNTVLLPPTGGWNLWQPFTSVFDLDAGTNLITMIAAGDTGILFNLANLRLEEGVGVRPRVASQGLALVRSKQGILLTWNRADAYRTLDLVTTDGRILSHQNLGGRTQIELSLPLSHPPLWIRLQGQSITTLAIPPER